MQDILNVQLNGIQNKNREEWQKVQDKRSRFLRAHVCSNKSSIYDVLFKKGKCFWMRVYEIPEGSKQLKVERFKSY
jgi:hypothetical protein